MSMTNHYRGLMSFVLLLLLASFRAEAGTVDVNLPSRYSMLAILNHANDTWQERNPNHGNHFWNRAVYHVGNMLAYDVTRKQQYLDYSTAWAERNNWSGATSNDTANWAWTYGEGGRYVLFGDNQVCFQVYADLYQYDPGHDPKKIDRALGVMGYEIRTGYNEYLWWVDGMFMVMPTMVKLYNITGDALYLEKMHDYWLYANQLMFDSEANLYYRDAKYIYPKHTTVNGLKDFWARGDGWAFATLARILDEMPDSAPYREEYAGYYRRLAQSLKECQQTDGYWTRSLLDPAHAPGRETSGTALITYAYATGIRLGLISPDDYGKTLEKAWAYLSGTAYQPDGTIGYIQPIGEKADPNQTLSASSYYDFGVGAFLMASAAVSLVAPDIPYAEPLRLAGATLGGADHISLVFNAEPNPDEARVEANYTVDGKAVRAKEISIEGRTVHINLADTLGYGLHTIEVANIHSAEGGEMQAGQKTVAVRTVKLDAPQPGWTVTAVGSQVGNPYTNVADNDLSTRWSQQGRGQWICFELDDIQSVYAVDMAFYNGDQRKFYFDIQTSTDGLEWTDVLKSVTSCGLTTQLERFAFAPTEAKFVRIVCNGNSQNDWNSPTEIRIRYTSASAIHAASHAGCNTDGPIFNLQGRRLSSPQQAEQYQIYIINGKKVMKR